jgi:hypothetical protein
MNKGACRDKILEKENKKICPWKGNPAIMFATKRYRLKRIVASQSRAANVKPSLVVRSL